MSRVPVLALFALSLGCGSPSAPTATKTTGPAPTPPAKTADATKDEVLGYLDGKKLPVPAGDRPIGGLGTDLSKEPNLTTILIARAKVSAVQLDDHRIDTADGGVNHGLTFLYEDGAARYACVARVKYKRVEGKIAFTGHEINQVTKQ